MTNSMQTAHSPSLVLVSCNLGVFDLPRDAFVPGKAFSFPSFLCGVATDLRVPRFKVPVRGVLVLVAALDAAGARDLDLTADLREARFLKGDSPLTPRARRISARSFPSDGTKMLVCVLKKQKVKHDKSEVKEPAREAKAYLPRSRKRNLSRS
jgi:hypothetical protein